MAPNRTGAASRPHGTGYKLLCWNCLKSDNLRLLKGYADYNTLRKHQGRHHNCWSTLENKTQCTDCLQWCEGQKGLVEHKRGQSCGSAAAKAQRVARPTVDDGWPNWPLYEAQMADLFDLHDSSSDYRISEGLVLQGKEGDTIANPVMGFEAREARKRKVLQRYAELEAQHAAVQLPTKLPVAWDAEVAAAPALVPVLPLPAPPPPAALLQHQQLPPQPALGDWETLQTSGLSALGYPESQVPHLGYYLEQSTGFLPGQEFGDAANDMAAPWQDLSVPQMAMSSQQGYPAPQLGCSQAAGMQRAGYVSPGRVIGYPDQDLLAPMAPQTGAGIQYDSSTAGYAVEMPQLMYETASEPSLHFPTPDGTPEQAKQYPATTFAPLDGAETGQQLGYDHSLEEIVGGWPRTAPLQDPSGGQMYTGTIPEANTAVAAPEMPLQYSFDFGQPAGNFLQDPSNAAAAAGIGACDFTDTFATVGAGNQQWGTFDFSGL